jgi:hypothetical protein
MGAGAVAGTVAGAVEGTVALKGAVAVIFLLQTVGKEKSTLVVTLILPIVWLSLVRVLNWSNISIGAITFFLFLGVFPLINALFDVLS